MKTVTIFFCLIGHGAGNVCASISGDGDGDGNEDPPTATLDSDPKEEVPDAKGKTPVAEGKTPAAKEKISPAKEKNPADAGGDEICLTFKAEKAGLLTQFKTILTTIGTTGVCSKKVKWTIETDIIDEAIATLEEVSQEDITKIVEILNKLKPQRVINCLAEVDSKVVIERAVEQLVGLFTTYLPRLDGALKKIALSKIEGLGDKDMNCSVLNDKLTSDDAKLGPMDALTIFTPAS